MIYLDNSASTFIKPKEVTKACIDAINNFSANPGRSGHSLSMLAGEKVFDVRKKVCEFLNAGKPENVVFTQNCTDALNMAVLGTAVKGGHIICSCNDHNSLARPIFELQKQGIVDVSVVKPQYGHMLTAKDIEPLLKPNTYMVALNHVSNVNGDMADLESIGELCAKKCILFLVDCAQSAGHINIDMLTQHIDMVALAPHKALYALQGIGVFAFSVKACPKPIRYGGTGTESLKLTQPTDYPEALESGTLAMPNICALEAGINFVEKNYHAINKKIDDLSTYLLFELSNTPNVITYTSPHNIHLGVIGFNIENLDSGECASMLSDEYGICVRGGLHCAGLKHKSLNTVEQGIVRASISYFNSYTECENFVKAIKKIAKKY